MYNHSTFFLVGQVKFEQLKSDIPILIAFFITCLQAFLTSYVAGQRNRNRTLWFVLGAVFGWIAFLFALFLPVKDEEAQEKREEVAPEVEKKQEESVWYYLDAAHKQFGPVTRSKLDELREESVLSEKSYVWREGLKEWTRLKDLSE